MGYPPPITFALPENTLVVADTHGFHARARATRPATRLAIYGSLRVNPFWPFTGPDLFGRPGMRNRKAQLLNLQRCAIARLKNRPETATLVGELRPCDPAVR
jgi:hypothetical protein